MAAAAIGLFAAGLVALRAPTPATAASVAKNPPAPQSVPQPRPAPETATGDFADPPRPDAMAASFQVRKGHTGFDVARSTPEDDATTSGTQRRYRNPDGSRTLLLSQTPVRFRDRSGRWVDIDRSLVAAPDGSLEPKAAPEGVHLSKNAQGAIATLDTPAGPIALQHPDVAASAATVRGDTASYANALPGGRDVALAAAAGGLEETVTLASAAAGPTYVDDVVLPAGVTARQGDGRVELVDAKGTVVAAVDGGSAFDATFPSNIGAATPVSVRLVSGGEVPAGGSTVPSTTTTTTVARGGTTLPSTTSTTVAPAAPPPAAAKVARVEVSVDSRWLAAAKFPVRIDPTFRAYFTAAASGGGADGYVVSGTNAGTAYANNYLAVGSPDGGASIARSLLRFDVSPVIAPGDTVISSALSVFNWYAPACAPTTPVKVSGLGGTFSASTTWNTQPPLDASGVVSTTSFAAGATGCAGTYETLDITSLAQR